jgi:hypothetical protein
VNRSFQHVATLVALTATLSGCASSPSSTPSRPALPTARAEQQLSGICPATVVFQNRWEPSTDNAVEYQLVGPGATIDAPRKRVIGPLLAGGKDTGVEIEIRSGGAAIGFTPVPAQMYLDQSITFGAVPTDVAISTSGSQPVTAVIAPTNKSPQVLMWDPASHPDWTTIADIGTSNAPVVVTKDSAFAPFLVAQGLIKQGQLDTGYSGNPARFVSDPTIAQQGYATQEPYLYEHEVKAWGKPIRFQLLADVGYSVYPEALSVRADDLGRLSACLRRIVPILQQAQLDYLRNPEPVNQLIVDTVARFNTGWTYSRGVADYAVSTARRLHLVANDTSGPLGGIDPARVQRTIDTFAPILAAGGAPVKPHLTAADIATSQFLDATIRLP